MCDVIYSVCDVMNAVKVMWWLKWCQFIKSGCDYMYSSKTPYIKWVWYHTKSSSEIITRVVVMTQIQWMQCQISWEWCQEYRACAVINNVVWCHTMWMWCLIGHIWCYTYSGCDIIHTKGVILSKGWVWWHRYSGCHVTNIVNVMSFTMHMILPYIAEEIS